MSCENRLSAAVRVGSAGGKQERERHQRAGPAGDADSVQEHGRPRQPVRRGIGGVTAGGKRKANAQQRNERERPARRPPGHADRDDRTEQRQQRGGRGRSVARAKARVPESRLDESHERQVERVEPLQADRRQRRDETDVEQAEGENLGAAGRRSDPRQEESAADAEEQAGIERDLAEPERSLNGPIGACGSLGRTAGAGCANRKHQRPANRMAVCRGDPPGQHMRAAGKFRRIDDERGVLQRIAVKRRRRTVRSHQLQHQRRHRLVEGERELLRRGLDDGAVGGNGGDQRGVREGGGGEEEARGR